VLTSQWNKTPGATSDNKNQTAAKCVHRQQLRKEGDMMLQCIASLNAPPIKVLNTGTRPPAPSMGPTVGAG